MKKISKKGKQVDLKKAYAQKMDKDELQQMDKDELQLFLHFKRRGFAVPPKKGKGSYDRKKLKADVA